MQPSSTDIVILAAGRSPVGRFLGALSKQSAVDLAAAVGETLLQPFDRSRIDQVILGNVLSAGQGMNIARQLGLRLGLPQSSTGWTVNMMCASGLQSVLLAAQAIQTGAARCVLCGGTESMSRAPYLLPRARSGYQFGDGTLVDLVLKDGLIDPGSDQHMGLTAEALAARYEISRAEQDAYALQSQQRYAAAQEQGLFDREIVPVADLARDEHPRPDTSLERLGKLKTSFASPGTVTAGNASGINDGAALLLVADADFAREHGLQPLARLRAGTACGCDPALMGLGPVHAIRRLQAQTQTSLDVYGQIEINEAFAAQVLACVRELPEVADRLNVHGGAIACGHPIGMSGARLAVHVVQQIAAGRISRGLAALCVGGGMGIAADFDRV